MSKIPATAFELEGYLTEGKTFYTQAPGCDGMIQHGVFKIGILVIGNKCDGERFGLLNDGFCMHYLTDEEVENYMIKHTGAQSVKIV